MRKKIIIRKKLTSFFETAKDLKKKNKLEAQKSGLDNLSRTFLSSLIIISIFFIAPLAINLTKGKMIFSKDYENNSKNNLKKLLENLIKNPKKLVIASNQMKKLSKDLEVKRKNKSATEFFSDVLIDLIKTNHKKISKPC